MKKLSAAQARELTLTRLGQGAHVPPKSPALRTYQSLERRGLLEAIEPLAEGWYSYVITQQGRAVEIVREG